MKAHCRSVRSPSTILSALSGTDVVGFGDPTHGTREFYLERYRWLRALVDIGFRALAIEASYSATQRLNEYIAGGLGDLGPLLAGLQAPMWDVEEFVAAIEWMRRYNRKRASRDHVRLYGLDIWSTAIGRDSVLMFFKDWVPEKLQAAAAAFESIASAESKGIAAAEAGQFDGALYQEVRSLSEYLAENQNRLSSLTSMGQVQEVQSHLRIIGQSVAANLGPSVTFEDAAELPKVRGLNRFLRSQFLAKNLLTFMEEEGPRTRWVVWAHIYHVGIGIFDHEHGFVANMGSLLRRELGSRYRAIGFEFDSGSYLGRPLLSDGSLGGFGVVHVPGALPESLPWYLARAGKATCFLDLRHGPAPSSVETWLTSSVQAHAMGWVYRDPPHLYSNVRVGEYYDGVIFLRRTSATHPTRSARRRVATTAAN